MRDAPWIIYGASGVTGRLVLAEALRRGHRPIVAGRDRLVHELGGAHSLQSVCVSLDDRPALEALLSRGSRVLHIAGPYGATAKPMLDACLATRTPYIDLNAEIDGLAAALDRDAEAKARGVAVIAGAGFGVAAAECVAMYVTEKTKAPRRLLLGVSASNEQTSRGAMMSRLGVLGRGGAWIRDSRLVAGPVAHLRFRASIGGVPYTFAAMPLADGLAAHRATGVPEVIAGVPVPAFMAPLLRFTAPAIGALVRRPLIGALLQRRARRAVAPAPPPVHRSFVWAQATSGEGTSTAVLWAGEGYAFAAGMMVRAAERLSSFDGAGVFTPGAAFGSRLVLDLDGVALQDQVDVAP